MLREVILISSKPAFQKWQKLNPLARTPAEARSGGATLDTSAAHNRIFRMGWALSLMRKVSFCLDRGIQGVLLGQTLQVLPSAGGGGKGERRGGTPRGLSAPGLTTQPTGQPGSSPRLQPAREETENRPGALTSGNTVPAGACPEARHAPGNGIQPGVGGPPFSLLAEL